jgi:hypothetical protein
MELQRNLIYPDRLTVTMDRTFGRQSFTMHLRPCMFL